MGKQLRRKRRREEEDGGAVETEDGERLRWRRRMGEQLRRRMGSS